MNIHLTPAEEAELGAAWKDAVITGTGFLKLTIRKGLERIAPEDVTLRSEFSLAGLLQIANIPIAYGCLWRESAPSYEILYNGQWCKVSR